MISSSCQARGEGFAAGNALGRVDHAFPGARTLPAWSMPPTAPALPADDQKAVEQQTAAERYHDGAPWFVPPVRPDHVAGQGREERRGLDWTSWA
ncbi:hypothetical protein [Micromonospora humidisoli]|uniref:Uncharacterized protein n=1 Tax=Micromonospora humidisoli TaxID=2807622 RepID=A0ABS2J4T7_9ACTN|nr:hypothetical protein [Micromonospora humidisoli]MBM7081354.1 hypothetical protein [Micromonospora humidisoli]